MGRFERPVWRSTSIPCLTIERVYGSGNFDDAGDDLVSALRIVSDYPDQYRSRFNFDSTHPNPWYHSMVFEIEGIPESTYERFVEQVAALGLADASEHR